MSQEHFDKTMLQTQEKQYIAKSYFLLSAFTSKMQVFSNKYFNSVNYGV